LQKYRHKSLHSDRKIVYLRNDLLKNERGLFEKSNKNEAKTVNMCFSDFVISDDFLNNTNKFMHK